MIYFDNAATGGEKPDTVISAAYAAIKFSANPGRSGHRLSLACLERVYGCRKLLNDFFGGYSYEKVIFTKSCTEALNIALLGGLKAGDEVVTTAAEHNSVLRPLEYLKSKGVKVKIVPLNNGKIDMAALSDLVNKNTRAAVVTLASNVTGCPTDMAEIRARIPEDCLLICDGAQACGHVKIDMKSSGIDALAVAGHKGMLAIQGSGALILSQRFNPSPITFGGTGSESNSLDMPDFYPDKLESGTLNYPAIVSLAEGALYLEEHMQKQAEKIEGLCRILVEGLSGIAGVKVYSAPNPFGIAAFSFENMDSEEAAYAFSEDYGICVRGGLHCAPLMHKALSSDGLVRASVSAFNSENECEIFLRAAEELAKKRRP